MTKYNKKIVDEICSLIKEDSYTITEICKKVGIVTDTYYDWLNKKSDFSDSIKKAENEFKENILIECNRSLRKLITGYMAQEKKVITVDSGKKDDRGRPIPKIKEQTIVDKHIQPNLGAIIHFQTNQDPDNWKNKHSTEVTGKDGKDLFAKKSVEELEDELKKIMSKIED